MATFECKVYKLTIEPHPNADRLELAVVGDYRSIVMKGQFETGDLGVYIPEGSVCPEWLIYRMGLEGKLAGKEHNRVKAVKLRGILSQGLIYPVDLHEGRLFAVYNDGDNIRHIPAPIGGDLTEELGVTKYEPPIPVNMAGEVFNAFGRTLKYDIENYKMHPDVLQEGENVVMTEKLHGTWCCFGYHPDFDHPVVNSKGVNERGLAFKFNEANENNLYIRALVQTIIDGENVVERAKGIFGDKLPFYILGEVYGVGVQDLHYGTTTPHFRVFDVYNGEPQQGSYAPARALQDICTSLQVEMVPELYRGPYSKAKMLELTDGRESVSGDGKNLREGIVIRPFTEREDIMLGRVILKSISEAYLLRKGGTEYN